MLNCENQPVRYGRRAVLKGAAATAVLAAAAPARATDALSNLDATGIAAAIRQGKLSAAEALDAAAARMRAAGAQLNCFSEVMVDEARTALRRLDRSAPFAGVPIVMKDEEPLAGHRFHFGSRLDRVMPVADRDGPVAALVKRAGFNVVARTTMSEFGALPTTETMAYGATRNPWSLGHTPGGSSGGAAAAVAAGILPLAHAVDGAGSIRIPASNCGLVGLKPSRGRVVKDAPAVAFDLVEPLCLTRTVRDTANYLAIAERRGAHAVLPPVGRVTQSSNRCLRIGLVASGLSGTSPSPEVAAGLAASATRLEAMGHTVEPSRWPFDGPAFLDDFSLLYAAEAAAIKKRLIADLGVDPRRVPELVEPASLAIASAGEMVPAVVTEAAMARVAAVSRSYFGWFDHFDVLLSPVLLTPPVPIGSITGALPILALSDKLKAYADYTMIQNATGGPAISLPLHWTADGMPVGMQFAGPLGGERTLLELAFALEEAQPWASRHPGVWVA